MILAAIVLQLQLTSGVIKQYEVSKRVGIFSSLLLTTYFEESFCIFFEQANNIFLDAKRKKANGLNHSPHND